MTVMSYGQPSARDHGGLSIPGFSTVATILGRVGTFFAELRWIFVSGLTMQANYNTLAAMSDEQLAKRGLTRNDIPEAVVAPFKYL